MTDQIRPWPKVGRLRKWGPVCLVLTICVGLGVVATRRTPTVTKAATTKLSGLAANPKLPITYEEAKEKGTTSTYTWGNCDPTTGRIRFPSVYAPPCVPVAPKSNGGSTFQGVTGDTIKVVYYYPAPNDIAGSLAGLLDSNEKVTESVRAYLKVFESSFETYGRKVEIIPFVGTGVGTDVTAARADAVKVASQIKAFASIGGPTQTAAYADELAARHVLCFQCSQSVPDSTFQKDAPYAWGTLSTPEQYLENIGILVARQLNNKNAIWAGDPKMRSQKRVFGTIHYEQDPPVFGAVSKRVAAQGAKVGYKAKVDETYILDIAKLPQTAAALVAKLKAEGVTTVMFLGDPLMPIYLTKAATAQNYHPEWIVTGTVMTDTTTLARLYDQNQWAHAFGVSTLPVRTSRSESDAYRIYRWYYGDKPVAYKTAALFYTYLLQLFQGIHMAGPDLTPQTFAGGMFRLPPTGGQPAAPHVSYGERNLFFYTKGADFVSVDDATLIWWDPNVKGPDEQDTIGKGMYRYVDGGKRYMPGKMPTKLQPFFDKKNSVTVLAKRPPELMTPTYAPPKDSPIARKGN